jgi:lipopolysaccharide transport system permease protein
VRYRRSYLGFMWTLAVPTAMALVYFFIFQKIAKIDIPNYSLLLIAGIVPWTFMSTSIATGTESLVNNFGILSKVPISYLAFPLAEVISGFINLVLSAPVLLLVCAMTGTVPGWSWLYIPVIYACLFLQAYGLSLFTAISYVYLRDIRHLVGIALQILLYLTPILYAKVLIPPEYLKWFYLNPMFTIFTSLHSVILENQLPSLIDTAHMVAWSVAIPLLSYLLYRVTRYSIVEKI